jgi:hypothetical protein
MVQNAFDSSLAFRRSRFLGRAETVWKIEIAINRSTSEWHMVVFAMSCPVHPVQRTRLHQRCAIPNRSPGISLTSAESYSAQSERRRENWFRRELGSRNWKVAVWPRLYTAFLACSCSMVATAPDNASKESLIKLKSAPVTHAPGRHMSRIGTLAQYSLT